MVLSSDGGQCRAPASGARPGKRQKLDVIRARHRGLNKLSVNPAIADRLSAFIASDVFVSRSGVAKSEYWKYFSGQLNVVVDGSSVDVEGRSGFYVPASASPLRRLTRRVARAVTRPEAAVRWLRSELKSRLNLPGHMTYERAFDAVMNHAEVSMPILSPFALNHSRMAGTRGVFASAVAVRRHYQAWSGYQASDNIFNHFYYQNILRTFIDRTAPWTVLEIGAGNGNFPSILYHDWPPIRVVLIDLPETLALAIPFLGSLFPDASLVMPHEAQVLGLPSTFDFAFLTVDQLGLLADDSIDLAINCHSFQEMTHQQIRIYFDLIQRVCRESAYFFSANRIEKIPCGPDAFVRDQPDPPNRAAEFPWCPHNEILVHEISKLTRLVQLDGVDVRLERIRKRRP